MEPLEPLRCEERNFETTRSRCCNEAVTFRSIFGRLRALCSYHASRIDEAKAAANA